MGVRLALRTLRRSPWYATTVVGTIALSMSLAATVFAVVDGVLFKPLPYAAPERLFYLQGSAGPGESTTAVLAPRDIEYLNHADPRVRVAAYGGARGLTHPSRPDLTIWSATIDTRFFDVLGQQPLVGGFTPDHYTTSVGDAPRPAIVSHAFWRQWLGGGTAVLGQTLAMVETRLLIVGVLPRDFVVPVRSGRTRPDVLFPLVPSLQATADRWSRSLDAVGRLDAGITPEEAWSKLDATLAARVSEYSARPQNRPGPYVAVAMSPLEAYLGRTERPLFGLAFAGAVLLVILGAVNVAGLFAARGRDRERELAIRVALGARRRELAKVMLTEAVLVGLGGGILGVLLAGPMLRTMLALLPDSLMLLKPPVIDWRVMVFALATSTVVVSVFAVAPAEVLVRNALSQRLSGSTSTPRVRSWSRGALLAAESAIGICLVVAGSLTLASFIVLGAEDSGFDSQHLAVLEVRTPGAVAPGDVQARHDLVLARVRSTPGVAAVASIGVPLLENALAGSSFAFPPGASGRHLANETPISGPFFEVAGLTVLEGRTLTESEIDSGRPLAVVSELTAKAYWPSGGAVGQVLADKQRAVTVVGVVEDARFGSLDDTRAGEIYIPRALGRRTLLVYLLKAVSDPGAIVQSVALAVQRDVPGVLVRRAESLERALSKSVRLHSFRTVLFGVSASAGLLLLAVGIAGLVATGVARRVREIGIRSALGAQRRQLVRMIIVEHLRPTVAGVAFGLLASWWTTRLLSAYLYQIDAHDLPVWIAAVISLLGVAILAAWIPARRASSVDPIVVLKTD